MSKNSKQKRVEHRGITYVGTKRNGVVAVKVKRTANGQLMNAGSLNTSTGEWQDGNKKFSLPDFVKGEFEKAFCC
ncbi:hypothetical protein IJJ49_02720 [Candidatus Saccharibacteria bacterium]|nr:hypothetical protein [Candidatus Saccharibacteria bacterium]